MNSTTPVHFKKINFKGRKTNAARDADEDTKKIKNEVKERNRKERLLILLHTHKAAKILLEKIEQQRTLLPHIYNAITTNWQQRTVHSAVVQQTTNKRRGNKETEREMKNG